MWQRAVQVRPQLDVCLEVKNEQNECLSQVRCVCVCVSASSSIQPRPQTTLTAQTGV